MPLPDPLSACSLQPPELDLRQRLTSAHPEQMKMERERMQKEIAELQAANLEIDAQEVCSVSSVFIMPELDENVFAPSVPGC